MCEILTSNYCSNRNVLKFDKEITKARILKYLMISCSYEFFATKNFLCPLKNNTLITAKGAAALLTLGTC